MMVFVRIHFGIKLNSNTTLFFPLNTCKVGFLKICDKSDCLCSACTFGALMKSDIKFIFCDVSLKRVYKKMLQYLCIFALCHVRIKIIFPFQ